eukprot:3023182-Prymnesium_polylepis.1
MARAARAACSRSMRRRWLCGRRAHSEWGPASLRTVSGTRACAPERARERPPTEGPGDWRESSV